MRTLGVAALGLCLGLLAAAFGAPQLYIPAVALVLLALAAECAARLAAWGTALSREPASATLTEGQRIPVATVISGPRVFRRRGEFALASSGTFMPRRWLEGDGVRFSVQPARRGRHTIEPSALRFCDPFGTAARTIQSPATELLVLPRIDRVSAGALATLAAEADRSRRRGPAQVGEVDGVRPAHEDTPANRIHWPTVARSGSLAERRLAVEVDARALVVLDAAEPASEPALDMAIRAAGSLAVALARAGGCDLLLPGESHERRLDHRLSSWPRVHAQLAVLEPGGPVAPGPVGRAQFVIWVCAQLEPRTPGADVTVTPFPRGDRGVLFLVAGCSAQRAVVEQEALAA